MTACSCNEQAMTRTTKHKKKHPTGLLRLGVFAYIRLDIKDDDDRAYDGGVLDELDLS